MFSSALPFFSITISVNSTLRSMVFRTKYLTNASLWCLWRCEWRNWKHFYLHPHLHHPQSWQFWCCLNLRIQLLSDPACIFLFGKVARYWQLFILDVGPDPRGSQRLYYIQSLCSEYIHCFCFSSLFWVLQALLALIPHSFPCHKYRLCSHIPQLYPPDFT